jgi:hypothetical protein
VKGKEMLPSTGTLRFEIAKLELKKDDVLVLKFNDIVEQDDLECLLDSLQTVLPKETKALILGSNDLTLYVIHKDEELSTESG